MRLQSQIHDRASRSAHTLAEVMVAVLVLGTMTVSLFAGLSSGFTLLRMAREDERATQILKGRIELIRLCRWDDLLSNPGMSFREHYDPSSLVTNTDRTVSNTTFVYVGTNWISAPTNVIPAGQSYANN